MIFGALVVGCSQEANATTTVIYGESIDGQIRYDSTLGYAITADSIIAYAQNETASREYRCFLSFDLGGMTPAIVDDAVVSFKAWSLNDAAILSVYAVDFGASLDNSDYDLYATGTFLGQFSIPAYPAVATWVSIDVPAALLLGPRFQIEFVDLAAGGGGRVCIGTVEGIYDPYLTINQEESTALTYYMDDGFTYSTSISPHVEVHNSTALAYTYEFDTSSNISRMSIFKGGAGWTLYSVTPYCNLTDTSTSTYLNSTLDGVTYRVCYLVPVTTNTIVYVSMYVSSTGVGLPFETFRLQYCPGLAYNNSSASDLTSPTFWVGYGNYTVAVLDYFGNIIETMAFVVNGQYEYVAIPLDVNSFKIFNQQDDFTKIRIYYANATSPIEFFCAPNEPVETFLRDGNYSVGVTMYNNHTALTTVWFSPSVNGSEFILIQGNTISQVISDVAGVYSLQTVITTMVTPDVVMVAEDLPSVPDETIIFIHPWSVIAASVNVNGSGMNETLWLPHQNTTGSYYTVSTDDLYLSGAWPTTIWLNYTNGMSFYHAHNLPSYLALDGGNYTLVTSASVNFTRHTEWREETLFYYTYYTTQKKYEVILDINNSMTADWTSVNWLIGLPEGAIIDMSSVKVYDLDNALYLTAGKNYDVSATGIKMLFTSLNSSSARHMKLTMYDANASSSTVLAIAYTDSYAQSSYLGKAYFKSTASWTNGQGATYSDEIKVKLDFQDDEQRFIVTSDIVIYDRVAGRALQSWEFTISDGVISIDHATVPVGEVQSYDIYFHLDMSSDGGFDLNTPIITLPGGGVISVFVLSVIALAGFALVAYMKKSRVVGAIVLVAACMLFILMIWDSAGAI
jgi:hypothetical protein